VVGKKAEALNKFLADHSATKSGKRQYRIFTAYVTYLEAWGAYADNCCATIPPWKVRCFNVFLDFCRDFDPHPINVPHYSRYDCPPCTDPHWKKGKAQLKRPWGEERCNAYLEGHKALVRLQGEFLIRIRDSLSLYQLLLIWDYTKFHEATTFKLHDLTISAYIRAVGKNGKLLHDHWDFFAEHKHDHNYSRTVWNLIKELINFSKFQVIYIFGDNGLKSKENLFYFVKLAIELNIQIELHFFAPYHGHSVCDQHVGLGKMEIRRKTRGKALSQREDILCAFRNMPDTEVVDIPEVFNKDLGVTQLKKGIAKFYAFICLPDGTIRCKTSSEEDVYIVQTIRQTKTGDILLEEQ